MAELVGQVAIVSGGLGDIGGACAIELARRGANVALSDADDKGRLAPLEKAIQATGRKCRFDRVNVTDAQAVDQWVDEVERDMGLPTLVIPAAGITLVVPLLDVSSDQMQHLWSVNVLGAFHLAQSAAKRLISRAKPGRIVFIGSWAAHAPHTQVPAYCVAKAGLRMLCQCMAASYAAHGILLNEVAPGWVDAGLSRPSWGDNPSLRRKYEAKVPIGQFLSAEEVAFHTANLCDPRNQSMTGSVVLCDGGLSLVNAATRGQDDS